MNQLVDRRSFIGVMAAVPILGISSKYATGGLIPKSKEFIPAGIPVYTILSKKSLTLNNFIDVCKTFNIEPYKKVTGKDMDETPVEFFYRMLKDTNLSKNGLKFDVVVEKSRYKIIRATFL